MHILLPIIGAIVVSATTSAASAIHPLNLNLRDEDPEDPDDSESCPIDDGDDGEYEEDFYIREDCNLTPDDTGSDLKVRAATTGGAACPTVPVVKFDCTNFPNACKGMCWNRYCKGQHGAYPNLLHRGEKKSSEKRRPTGGYQKPSKPKQPCNTQNTVDRSFNENPAWTSMDEFPMALMLEGGGVPSSDYGAGFRCIELAENSLAGTKMDKLLEAADVGHSNTASTTNQFDIEFINYSNIGEDWCNVDTDGRPTSSCVNDGYQFIAKKKTNGRGWDYFALEDGRGWTGIKP